MNITRLKKGAMNVIKMLIIFASIMLFIFGFRDFIGNDMLFLGIIFIAFLVFEFYSGYRAKTKYYIVTYLENPLNLYTDVIEMKDADGFSLCKLNEKLGTQVNIVSITETTKKEYIRWKQTEAEQEQENQTDEENNVLE